MLKKQIKRTYFTLSKLGGKESEKTTKNKIL